LLTTDLTGKEWLACFGLAAMLPLVIETSKWIRRRRMPESLLDTQRAVTPMRALSGASAEVVRGS
jgi:P-type Ca2+ transporter type 2C